MLARAAALFAMLIAGANPGLATPPNVIIEAAYSEPTTRYAHGVLGDAVEWGALVLTVDMCFGCEAKAVRDFTIRLPENRVFEDIAPRVVDLDGDESPEVIVVESDAALGARLAVYDEGGLVAATPFIGRAHRWLAPVGAADFDGDGHMEIAYVDRPHLAKTLRVWRFAERELVEIASAPGFTNHRIGWDFIPGGIRDCGGGPEMVLASGDWRYVMAVRLEGGKLAARELSRFDGVSSLKQALACRP